MGNGGQKKHQKNDKYKSKYSSNSKDILKTSKTAAT